jgi:serine/threonine protein kinase
MLIHEFCFSKEFLGANIFDDRPFIVMPFLKNGNARDYVYDHPDCDRIMIVRCTYSQGICIICLSLPQLYHISLGLVYLHNNNVMHGDLKAVLYHFSVSLLLTHGKFF